MRGICGVLWGTEIFFAYCDGDVNSEVVSYGTSNKCSFIMSNL
jgi:hypothetical protein